MVLLGVAAQWTERKGLDVFIRLARELPDEYCIFLVGLEDEAIKNIPEKIMCIKQTHSIDGLRMIYSIADVFVNPTIWDNYPTVNMEAISCGTPVVTYNTGGSGESADKFGAVVSVGDIDEMKRVIATNEYVSKEHDFSLDNMTDHYLQQYRL